MSNIIIANTLVYLCLSKNKIGCFSSVDIAKFAMLLNHNGYLQPCHHMLLTQCAQPTEGELRPAAKGPLSVCCTRLFHIEFSKMMKLCLKFQYFCFLVNVWQKIFCRFIYIYDFFFLQFIFVADREEHMITDLFL